MTAPDPVLLRVWKTLADLVGPERAPDGPSAACPLGPGGFWLDSIDFFDAVLACEDAFGITLELETDFDTSQLRTVGDLVALVRNRGGR